MQTLRERIIDAMAKRGMKQTELAQLSGVSRSTVSLWVGGTTKSIEGEILFRAANALQVNPRWLATGEPPQKSTADEVKEKKSIYNSLEQIMLHKFRQLNDKDRKRAIAILDVLIGAKK